MSRVFLIRSEIMHKLLTKTQVSLTSIPKSIFVPNFVHIKRVTKHCSSFVIDDLGSLLRTKFKKLCVLTAGYMRSIKSICHQISGMRHQ